MDRRQFLASGSAAALAAAVPAEALAQMVGYAPASEGPGGTRGDAALNAEFERIFQQALARSPELATSLGLDKGANAAWKTQLTARTAERRQSDLATTKAALARLDRFEADTLSAPAKLNMEVIRYSLTAQTVAPEKFGIDSVIRPYRIFQQGGAYFQTPDFLNTAHTINSKADADAYLARLDGFAVALDADSAVQKAEAAKGLLAPGWSIDLTLGQMAKLRGQPAASSSIVQSLVKRVAAKGVAGDWQAQAAKIVEGKVYPALDR
ncbi:MAG: DUF885 family protein, partial [Sphingomonadales bacterium]